VPDKVARVEIEYANGPDAGDIVTSTASPAKLESDGPTLCVTLRSNGAAGRGSPDSDRTARADRCQVTRYTWYSTPSVAIRPSATNIDVLSHA
jgi:hypothetical protein